MPTTEIDVFNFKFQTSQPYEAGQVLAKTEADFLNKSRKDKIKASLTKIIKDFTPTNPDGTEVTPDFNSLSPSAQKAIQEKINSIDSTFKFSSRINLSTLDPVSAHAMKIAMGIVDNRIKANNLSVDIAQKRSMAEEFITKNPQIRAAAERHVAEQERLAQETAELIDIEL